LDKKIVVAGYVGLEGSLKITKEREGELELYFPKSFVKQIKMCESLLINTRTLDELGLNRITLPIDKEGYEMVEDKDVMIPLGEQSDYISLWDSLWNICQVWQIGVEIEISDIPIRQETIEVSQFAELNPYMLPSRGSYVILTSEAEEIKAKFNKLGIEVKVIGKTTKKREKIIKRGDHVRHMPRIRGTKNKKSVATNNQKGE
jgi:hypothetical protein